MSEPPALAALSLDSVPVFPLPGLVLFPGTRLPLHLFEPRYRALIADCLAGDAQRIVIAQLGGDWRDSYEGRPAIVPTAGLGVVRRHRKNADGTYDVLLEGEARVFIEAEAPEQADGPLYRVARVRVLPERLGRLDDEEPRVLWALAREVAALIAERSQGFELSAGADDAPGLLVDRLADQLVAEPAARQDLLETLDVAQRVQVLITRLATLRDELLRGSGKAPTLN